MERLATIIRAAQPSEHPLSSCAATQVPLAREARECAPLRCEPLSPCVRFAGCWMACLFKQHHLSQGSATSKAGRSSFSRYLMTAYSTPRQEPTPRGHSFQNESLQA